MMPWMAPAKSFIPAVRFHFLTPCYDIFMRHFFKEPYAKILKNISPGENDCILDIGCGPGNILINLKEKFPKASIAGLDIDPKMIPVAKKKIEKAGFSIDLIEASATEIPFPPNSFDVALSTLLIHHLETKDKKIMLCEAFRVIKPGGKFYLFDFAPPKTFLGKFFSKIYRHLECIDDGVEGKYPDFLKEAGFQNIHTLFHSRKMGLEFELIEARK